MGVAQAIVVVDSYRAIGAALLDQQFNSRSSSDRLGDCRLQPARVKSNGIDGYDLHAGHQSSFKRRSVPQDVGNRAGGCGDEAERKRQVGPGF